ncbi:type II toxin-antitoxin system RelE/ParE family toxin [Dyadobacter alkalitolerans]|uniref:type II toxin-antitoxin system RelE/ParE family toxin n=1 Tax=Dyadobacter alkalitolerans TaxID=492736 RepID=UPI0009FFB910
MSEYKISKLDQNDLENIWEYTLREWSSNQAEKYLDGLLNCFQALGDKRIEGKPAEHIREEYFKCRFLKHQIFYRQSPDYKIEIIRVLHVSMDVEKQFDVQE